MVGQDLYFVDQKACRVGSFCSGGIEYECPAGTFGVDAMQINESDCVKCPVGTYNANSGSVGISACLLCPTGTYADDMGSDQCKMCPLSTFNSGVGGNSSAQCIRCTGATISLPGSSKCHALGSASFSSASRVAIIRNVIPPELRASDPVKLAIYICTPIATIFSLPSLILVVLAIRKQCLKRGRGVHGGPKTFQACLHGIDVYALAHDVDEGEHPIKQRTNLGGAFSLLATGAFICIAIYLGIDYYVDNALLTSSLLPAELPILLGYASVPAHRVESRSLPPFFDRGYARGLEIHVFTHGPKCGDPTLQVSALLSGNFSSSVDSMNATTASFEHSFVCLDCSFGPLSSASITYDSSCQAFHVIVALVGATGSESLASFRVADSSSVNVLSSVDIRVFPQLQLFNDTTARPLVSKRGYIIGDASLSISTVHPSVSTQLATVLNLDLSVGNAYTLMTVLPIRTAAQLLSSIIGLVGLFSAFGIGFVTLENWCGRQWKSLKSFSGRDALPFLSSFKRECVFGHLTSLPSLCPNLLFLR